MEKVTFEPMDWPNQAAFEQFALTPGVLSPGVMYDLELGEAQLFFVRSAGVSGWMVTRTEGEELVVCAVTGRGLVPTVKAVMAGQLGDWYDTIRCHTSDWRIEALYQRAGLEFSEVVYRAGVNRGR